MSDSLSSGTEWNGLSTGRWAYALAVLSVVTFVGGLFLEQPLIFVAIPLTIFLALVAIVSENPRVDVRVTRTTEKVRLREGESTRVRLRVTNESSKRIPMLQLRDTVPRELFGRSTLSAFSLTLKARESKDLFYEVGASEFGVYRLGPLVLSVSDSTGLFESRTELKGYTRIAVFPRTAERLTHFAIRPRQPKPWPGEIAARRTGPGIDYYNIRQFVPGESTRRINWKASARQGEGDDKLLVNDYMAELGADVLLIVDAGRSLDAESARDSTVAYTARAALSIAERLLHDRNRVGLLTTGSNPRRIAAAYGRRQFERIALPLLELKPGDSDVRWWMERSIHFFFPKVSQIIFVSALLDNNSIAAATEIARYGGHDVIVVSPNPLRLGMQSRKRDSRERVIARRLAELDRETDLIALRSANVLVIDWTTSDSLEEVVEVHRRALARHAALVSRGA